MSSSQISAEQLYALMGRDTVKILDGSWALDGTDMSTSFRCAHIPTAQFFDLDDISDHSQNLPHMAPPPAQFADAVGKLGISEADHVVIYDQQGLFSAARVWWTFKLMGHARVQVLAGGFPAWTTSSRPVSDKVETPIPKAYQPQYNADMVATIDDLLASIGQSEFAIFDARSRARFEATAPEPRAGLTGGHIPCSLSLPFGELLANGQLKPAKDLNSIFERLGLTLGQTAITTCGSGVTAAIISLALHEIGHEHIRLYDGSWAEWGQARLQMPIEP